MNIEHFRHRNAWSFGIAFDSHARLRIGVWRWLWQINADWPRTPCFQGGDEQSPAQWLFPIPFVSKRPWLLITWSWPPSVNRI